MIHNETALPLDTTLQEYRIESVLGVGGFGITYLALDMNLHKQVVIKEFLPSDIAVRKESTTVVAKSHSDEESYQWGMERFLLEAQTLAKFNHPNIVKINRFFKANNTAYFVMDYEEGEDLQTYLDTHTKKLTQQEINTIILPILDGLKEVHSHNFLHRDIKPGNIFIQTNGSPLLIDFGASRFAMGAKSKSLSIVLTEGYAPKEQYSSSSQQGAYTDIYSMGAVLYRMATGTTPPEASRRSDLITDGEEDPYQRLQDNPALPYSDAFKQAVDWALAFRPKERPQSVEAFKEALTGRSPKVDSEAKTRRVTHTDSKSHQQDKTRVITPKEDPRQSQAKTRRVEKPYPSQAPQESRGSNKSYAMFISIIVATLLLVGGGWYALSEKPSTKTSIVQTQQEAKNKAAREEEQAKRAKELAELKQFRKEKREREAKAQREKEAAAVVQREREAKAQREQLAEAERKTKAERERLDKAERERVAKIAEEERVRRANELAELEQFRKEKRGREAQIQREKEAAVVAQKQREARAERERLAKAEREAKRIAEENRKVSLTITTEPSNAKVQITNIKPRYTEGIKLKKGTYKVKVSKKGYKSVRKSIVLKKDLTYSVKLVKEKPKVSGRKYGKWITPKDSVCKANGGKIRSGVCEAQWKNAKTICSASGGRLPTPEELRGVVSGCGGTNIKNGDTQANEIMDRNAANKTYQSCYKAKGFPPYSYWSSTTYTYDGYSSFAWYMHFGYGYLSHIPKTGSNNVRCVRGGQ